MAPEPEWQLLARQKLMVRAIKTYREQQGVRLKEAKEIVERWWEENCLSPLERQRMAVDIRLANLLGDFLDRHPASRMLIAGRRYICDGVPPEAYEGADLTWYEDNSEGNLVPRLAVLIVSPEELYTPVSRRIRRILREGFPLLWVVHLELRAVVPYGPSQPWRSLRGDDVLSGEEVLPGLHIRVAERFA